jgi:hypothetical protein
MATSFTADRIRADHQPLQLDAFESSATQLRPYHSDRRNPTLRELSVRSTRDDTSGAVAIDQ